MKTDIETKSLKELSIIGALSSIVFLVTLLEIFDNAAILASTQDANTTEVSILSDASRLIDTACQPNSVNIEDGDIIVWNNDDSSPHTVTERNGSTRSGNRSDDESDSGILEKIIDEIITNIAINIRNNLGGGEDDDDNSSSEGSSSSAEFDSGIMQSGQTFSYTFDSSGTFEYYCAVHPSMVAEIVVS